MSSALNILARSALRYMSVDTIEKRVCIDTNERERFLLPKRPIAMIDSMKMTFGYSYYKHVYVDSMNNILTSHWSLRGLC